MKTLTIVQPYAELIAQGQKRVENRTWYTGYRGEIFIHAGKAKRYGYDTVEEIAQEHGVPLPLTMGAVIASAMLVDCIKIEAAEAIPASHPLAWVKAHKHTYGPYCWILADVKRLAAPVYINGPQGLWEWDGKPGPVKGAV